MTDLSQSGDFHDSNLLTLDLDLSKRVLTCRVETYLTREEPRGRDHLRS